MIPRGQTVKKADGEEGLSKPTARAIRGVDGLYEQAKSGRR